MTAELDGNELMQQITKLVCSNKRKVDDLESELNDVRTKRKEDEESFDERLQEALLKKHREDEVSFQERLQEALKEEREKFEEERKFDRERYEAECKEFNKQRSAFDTAMKALQEQIETTDCKITTLTEEIEGKKDSEFELKQTNRTNQIELSKLNRELLSAQETIVSLNEEIGSLKEKHNLVFEYIKKQQLVFNIMADKHSSTDSSTD